MSVNFSPSLEPYKETGSFRFWCQKVLPLVYDDSLSYYELLCKVVKYLKDVISNIDRLRDDIDNLLKAYNMLQEYVNNYFDNLDVQEEINNKLDQMAENGVLQEILDGYLGLIQFVDNSDTRERYKKSVCEVIASYLSSLYFNRCLVGQPKNIGNAKPITIYNESKGYTQLLTTQPQRFDYSAKQKIGGNEYNIIYSDCTTTASLITKAIMYKDSPYLKGFNNPEIALDELISSALENPDLTKNYTYDCYNNWVNTATIMMNSGTKTRFLYTNIDGVETTTPYLNTLETGDLIWFGCSKPAYASRLYGIHHIGIFVKDLDELNEFAGTDQQFIALDNKKSDRGYVFHCAGGIGGVSYDTSWRIETIEDMLGYDANKGYYSYGVYSGRPTQNLLNSNKQNERATGIRYFQDQIIIPKRFSGSDIVINRNNGSAKLHNATVDNLLKVTSLAVFGSQLSNNTDLNSLISNGVYTNKYSQYTFPNKPPTANSNWFDVINLGFDPNGGNGCQIYIGYRSKTTMDMAIRWYGTTWSDWNVILQ